MNMNIEQSLTHMTLSQKCIELSNLIREKFASNMSRSVLAQYRPIVEDIFGIQPVNEQQSFLQSSENKPLQQYIQQPQPLFHNQVNPDGWQLKILTRQKNLADYDAVLSFLHPDGIFFALIKSLMMETSAKFEFPISQFPPYFRSLIDNGTAPPFFSNKIISTSYKSASHLILNPFEFYIFHFSLYILNNSGPTYDPSNVLANEPAYFALLKIYLNYFVPIETVPRTTDGLSDNGNSNQQSSLWQSLSSKTTSILNLATSGNQTAIGNNGANPPSLFKASLFQPQTPFSRNISSNYIPPSGSIYFGQGEHLGSIEWRCSTFLLMLTELWFGNIPTPKTNYILRSDPLDDMSIPSMQPYSANIDQMAAVRIVIKHLHSFSNSFTYSPLSHINSHGLAEIKQAIWTSKYPLQKRLYNFTKVAFNRWPLDYTFRQPLEAWLSYIQPWRYVRLNSNNNELNNDLEDLDANARGVTLIDVPSVDNHWRNFISDNLLYYTVIFFLLVDRLLKLDLSSSRNALMLFRVIKVYSQPGFLVLLREAEEAVIRNNVEHSFNRSPPKFSTPSRSASEASNVSKAKLLAPSFLASGRVSTPKTRIGPFEHHLSNLENDSEFCYVSLFSPQAKQHMTRLLAEIQKSRILIKEFVQNVEVRSKLRSRGWLESIRSFLTMDDACFESKDEREMYKDKIQAEDYLKFASSKITQYFDVQVPEINLPERNANNLTNSQRIFFNF